METDILSVSALSLFLLEFTKFVLRRIINDPKHNFDPKFYIFLIPFFNALLVPLAAYLGIPGYNYPTDLALFLDGVTKVGVQSVVQMIMYTWGIKTLKGYKA